MLGVQHVDRCIVVDCTDLTSDRPTWKIWTLPDQANTNACDVATSITLSLSCGHQIRMRCRSLARTQNVPAATGTTLAYSRCPRNVVSGGTSATIATACFIRPLQTWSRSCKTIGQRDQSGFPQQHSVRIARAGRLESSRCMLRREFGHISAWRVSERSRQRWQSIRRSQSRLHFVLLYHGAECRILLKRQVCLQMLWVIVSGMAGLRKKRFRYHSVCAVSL